MSYSNYLRIVDPAAPCTTMPEILAYEYTFPLDPFQQHAISAISRNENVLVTAKTGSGKTLVGEYQIAHSLQKGRRVFYTTPIKSLSNQKFYDLKRMFPDRVGIMTGDVKFRPDAQIVIMTTEILRNLLYKRGTSTEHVGITANLSINNLDAVIFDECHYINDRDRGAIWEETMILLPRDVNLIMLSATIDAPEQFASWLGDLKQRPIHLISTQYRIVPLSHGVYRGEDFLEVMDSKDHFKIDQYRAWISWRNGQKEDAAAHKLRVAERRRGGYEDGPVNRGTDGPKSFVHQMNAMVRRLDAQELLPAIFFVFSRKNCERYAKAVEDTLIDSSDAAAVRNIIDFHLHRYGEELQRLEMYHTMRRLLEKGIAFHHSGLLPILKEIVELLFGRGLIKLLFATETFAVGINMPTKVVIFTGLRKYDDATGGPRLLNTDEYIQMAGRAGRRGKDIRGIVLYLPDREAESVDDMKRIMTGKRATFQSRMTFHYDFLLKTLQIGNLRWLDIMHDSYWYRRHDRNIARCKSDLESAKDALTAIHLSDSERVAMEEGDTLNRCVKESVNAARREAQRRLEAWKRGKVGPRWFALEKEIWPNYKRAIAEVHELENEYAALQEPQRDVEPTLEVLRRLAFMEGEILTPLGQMATEVNEAHTLLMPLLYRSRILIDMEDPRETLAILAVFASEGNQEDAPTLAELNVPDGVRNAIQWIRQKGYECAEVEAEVRAISPEKYWDIDVTWVEPVWRYLQGDSLGEIAAGYGIYEGNLIRILSKMGNILEEWRVLSSLNDHVLMLDKMRNIEQLLMTGIASSESLYLRLT